MLPLIIMIGCESDNNSQRDENAMAMVGDKVLYINEFQEWANEYSDSSYINQKIIDKWIKTQLMVRYAKSIGLDKTETYQYYIKRMSDTYLVNILRNHLYKNHTNEVSEEDILEYYQSHKEQFVLNKRYVRYRHIVTDNLTAARNAKRNLSRGIPWKTIAQNYSINPEQTIRNSELYHVAENALKEYPVLNGYFSVIGINEISPIRRIGKNYHFIQLMEEIPEGSQPKLEWTLEQIKTWLIMENRKRYYNDFITKLYLQAEGNNELYINQSAIDTLLR